MGVGVGATAEEFVGAGVAATEGPGVGANYRRRRRRRGPGDGDLLAITAVVAHRTHVVPGRRRVWRRHVHGLSPTTTPPRCAVQSQPSKAVSSGTSQTLWFACPLNVTVVPAATDSSLGPLPKRLPIQRVGRRRRRRGRRRRRWRDAAAVEAVNNERAAHELGRGFPRVDGVRGVDCRGHAEVRDGRPRVFRDTFIIVPMAARVICARRALVNVDAARIGRIRVRTGAA